MINQIAVLGAGTMGHGIAETFALVGYQISLYEVNEQVRTSVMGAMKQELDFMAENGMITQDDVAPALGRITLFDNLKDAVSDADYVIEAAPEILSLKQDMFAELDRLCKPACVLASNTSSLALDDMMVKVSPERKAKMMVCHWYNPAHLMPLVELSFFGNMPEDTFREVAAIYEKAGKQTAKILKDVPGLVANRIQQGVAREVFSIIEQGIANPEDVDKALKFGPAFRYATTGQLEVSDMGGLDIWCTVGDNLLAVMDNRQCANPLLREKVAAGQLGIKSGEGFFAYPAEQVPELKSAFHRRLIQQLQASKNYIV
jgi:3-hydroxyacyl-CoA dehydrogenase